VKRREGIKSKHRDISDESTSWSYFNLFLCEEEEGEKRRFLPRERQADTERDRAQAEAAA